MKAKTHDLVHASRSDWMLEGHLITVTSQRTSGSAVAIAVVDCACGQFNPKAFVIKGSPNRPDNHDIRWRLLDCILGHLRRGKLDGQCLNPAFILPDPVLTLPRAVRLVERLCTVATTPGPCDFRISEGDVVYGAVDEETDYALAFLDALAPREPKG